MRMNLVGWSARGGLAALFLAGLVGAASAHTSYLAPSVFATAEADIVTIEASFAEDFMFRPEIAVQSQDFHVLRPDGRRDAFDRVEPFRQLTVLESDLTEAGTYRFTTGERLGRTSTLVRTGGEWRPLAPGETAPRGAQVERSQTATVADVYVTKGAPSRTVVDKPIGRLVIRPITHPNAIYVEEGFNFEVLFDGSPLAGQEIVVDRQGGDYEEPRFQQSIRTDAQGRAHLRVDRAGVYLIMTRFRAAAPAGSETPYRSYTTSLTFEATR
jgi:uncharacterized GH25 family protein